MGTKVRASHSSKTSQNGVAQNHKTPQRIEVLKTYKIFIGGKFPRTESGRYYSPQGKNGKPLANICLSSRKDFRDAVVAARKALGIWAGKTAYNRSQILYRMGEILEGRKAQFTDELIKQGATQTQAKKEVELSIDRLIYYAGWCDKYTQIFSSVNPVASSHFNFSTPEPTGVVAQIAPQDSGLLGLVSVIAPAIAGGNTVVVLASEEKPLCAISFAEVINASDVPGGVINILTGKVDELYTHMSTHMDINALVYAENNRKIITELQKNATQNLKRIHLWQKDWFSEEGESPYLIMDLQEIKTTWHPIEHIAPAGGGY